MKKDFSKLRHKLSKSEINKFRKNLYGIKHHRKLSAVEIRKTEKNLFQLEKSLLEVATQFDKTDIKSK